MNDADHLSYLGTSDTDLHAAWERAVREEAEARSRKERHRTEMDRRRLTTPEPKLGRVTLTPLTEEQMP